MKIKENILEVPEQASIRNLLRKAARELISEKEIVPIASFSMISQLAE